MKGNHHLLKKSVESLKMIQAEMHDVMDSSRRAELEEVIADLEQCGTNKSPTQILEILGKCLALVPAVEKLIRLLSEF